jgi:hypothetical protein
MPDQQSPFSQSALPTNERGRLTDEQSRLWAGIAKRRRQSVRGVAYVFAAISALLLFANGPAAKGAGRAVGVVSFLAVAAILVVGSGLEPVNADAREGRVESVEGAIAKHTRQVKSPGRPLYLLDVGGRRLQAITRAAYDAAPDAGIVRAYFLPRSRRVVNLEQLADPPVPAGPGAAQEVFQHYAHALLSGDRTARAEASAQVAALKHVIEGSTPGASTGGKDLPRSSGLRAEDLYGTWTNPVMTVTFLKNGVATLTTTFGGTSREGHWSIDASGRLLADASGSLEPLDASLNGNKLTIVIEGQRLAFTRVEEQ